MKQLIHKTSKTIKKSLLILFFATMALTGFAQVAINADGSSPDASAMLDVKSSNKGLLIPRLTEAERNAISSPATGLMIFQTNNTTGFYYYDGSNWEVIGSGAFSIDDLLDGKAGGNSVFLGDSAGTNDDGTDNYNTAVGYNALQTNTGARYNVAFGGSALKYSTGGSNTACGTGSSIYNTTGSFNTSVGRNALFCNTTGEGNTGIGSNANYYNEEGSYNTIVGFGAGSGAAKHNKSGNIFLGYHAGYNETGNNKLYIENSNSTTPLIYGEFDNDIIKINGDLEVTGSFVGIGIDDLSDGKTGGTSVFLGLSAGINDDGTANNTAVGFYALSSNTSSVSNAAFGYSALNRSTGGFNTACGCESSRYNTTGTYNTSVGTKALFYNTTGWANTGLGSNANYYNEEGSYNTIVGYDAGMGTAKHNKSGNIFLGYQAGYNETGDNKLYIENSNSATPLIYGDFNSDILVVNGKLGVGVISPTSKLHIDATSGENGIRVQIGGITKLKVASNGSVVVGYNATSPTFALQLQNSAIDLQGRGIAYSWTTYSDGRLKTEQKELEYGLNEVMQLQPKSYFHHSSETSEDGTFTMLSSQKTFTFGFIAQELNQIIPEAVYVPEDETKNLWAIDYEKLIPVLTKAMQEQQQEIETLKTEIEQMKQMIREQRK